MEFYNAYFPSEWRETLIEWNSNNNAYNIPHITDIDSMNKLLAVYQEMGGPNTPKIALLDASLHIRQMVDDVENFIAQECSRRLVELFRDQKLTKEFVRGLGFWYHKGENKDLLFYTWNDIKGACHINETFNVFIKSIILEVQTKFNLNVYIGSIRAAKEIGNSMIHPTNIWDRRLMYVAIDAIFPETKKSTYIFNNGLKFLCDFHGNVVIHKLIRD